MPKNDDGEFELILGNKQLLGVFFIVIVLLAVFFTMGYIVGRNSTPLITADTGKSGAKPLVVDSPAPKTETPAATPEASAPPAAEPVAKQPETPKAVTKAEPPPKKEKPADKPVSKKEEPPAKKEIPGKGRTSEPLTEQPEQGKTYLQLVATGKPDADAMVDLLRKQGFKAFNYQVPDKPALYRVLVGPVPDGGVNKLRADLQAKSFPGDHAVINRTAK